MLVAPSVTRDLKIFTSTLTALALVLTAYRVIYRYAMRKFWWEDACAIVALIGSVICMVASWLHFELAGQPSVISLRIYVLTYPCVVWSVRLSILMSILRIKFPSRNLRRVMIFITGLFVSMWLSITFAGRYASGCPWHTSESQRDKAAKSVAIFELIADVLSDCTLISLPILALRSVKLPHSLRRIIITAYSSIIFVTILSFFRAACQFFIISPLISVAIDVEVACSLFTCNSLFITTLIYRNLRRNDDGANLPSSHSPSTSEYTLQLTTIYLDAFASIISGDISFDHLATNRSCDCATEKHCEDIKP